MTNVIATLRNSLFHVGSVDKRIHPNDELMQSTFDNCQRMARTDSIDIYQIDRARRLRYLWINDSYILYTHETPIKNL